MKEKQLISIIVPIYNTEKYLENCLNSIINQTYENIEILLIDDGSTDNSWNICNQALNKDKRIKIFHKGNGGLSDARNYGIEKATGKYITFIDSDDDIAIDYIDYLYSLIRKYNTMMSIAAYTVISGSKRINIGTGYEEKIMLTEEALKRLLCEEGYTISSCAKMYKKELFDNIEFPIGKLCEDNGTTYKLIMKCDKIAYGNRSIYNYYKREKSIMTSKFNLRKLDLIELSDNMCNEIIDKYPNLIEYAKKKKINARFSVLRQMPIENLKKEEIEECKKIEKYLKERRKYILKGKQFEKREKLAIISLLFGRKIFYLSWKLYCKIKY